MENTTPHTRKPSVLIIIRSINNTSVSDEFIIGLIEELEVYTIEDSKLIIDLCRKKRPRLLRCLLQTAVENKNKFYKKRQAMAF